MSVRITILFLAVAFLAIYAWKDWFRSLCGLVVMMAVMQHEDMPKTILGIQGFNPWNMLLLSIAAAWAVRRRQEGLRWDLPPYMTVLFLIYLGVIVVGVIRAALDMGMMAGYPVSGLLSEELINTVKWFIPGLLLFDGARSRSRMTMALLAIGLLYVLLAAQMVKNTPGSCLGSNDRSSQRMRAKAAKLVGYSTCDLSTILAGASWGIVGFHVLCRKRYQKILLAAAVLVTIVAQAMTGGRAGYLSWGVVGLSMGLLRWRKWLWTAPVIVVLLYVLFPGPAARLLEGTGEVGVSGEEVNDEYAMTSGRNLAWPVVIDKIQESPMLGFGRLAMQRTGLSAFMDAKYPGEGFPHPHNAYLEWLLDNGLLGFIPVMLFLAIVLVQAARLFAVGSGIQMVAGGLAFGALASQLAGGMGSQHFYPREGSMAMWAAIFMMLRAHVERLKARETGHVIDYSANQDMQAAAMSPVPFPSRYV